MMDKSRNSFGLYPLYAKYLFAFLELLNHRRDRLYRQTQLNMYLVNSSTGAMHTRRITIHSYDTS